VPLLDSSAEFFSFQHGMAISEEVAGSDAKIALAAKYYNTTGEGGLIQNLTVTVYLYYFSWGSDPVLTSQGVEDSSMLGFLPIDYGHSMAFSPNLLGSGSTPALFLLAVGAPAINENRNPDFPGAVTVWMYEASLSIWTEAWTYIPEAEGQHYRFGSSVVFTADDNYASTGSMTLWVGAPGDGTVFKFLVTHDALAPVSEAFTFNLDNVLMSTTDSSTEFGYSLARGSMYTSYASYIMIGDPSALCPDFESTCGKVHIYNGTELVAVLSGNSSQPIGHQVALTTVYDYIHAEDTIVGVAMPFAFARLDVDTEGYILVYKTPSVTPHVS